MTFNSVQYALFLPPVLFLYHRLKHRQQNALLLVASYIFYGAWDWRFCGLMLFSTCTDYIVGKLLAHDAPDRTRRRIFFISLAVNLGILATFKYFDFFVTSFSDLASSLGWSLDVPTLQVLLPVGISFYTFHGISYTFDVYRREIEPATDLLSFAVFIAFFPQLVAGPIGRAHLQLPQFEHPRTKPDREQVTSAVRLIVLGLFKKVVLADSMGPIADTVFGMRTPGTVSVLVGAYAFAIQIYCDFSGYSDMARGSSRLFGIELIRNFEQPYLSRNITEFWRRWHISLSTWLRDYLYVPLGGNRGGRTATYRNLMITMTLGGLWHGAGIGFVVWGVAHGALLSVHRAWSGRRRDAATDAPLRRGDIPSIALTFHVVALVWIFFRASTGGQVASMFSGLVRPGGALVPTDAIVLVVIGLVTMFTLDLLVRRHAAVDRFVSLPTPVRVLTYVTMLAAVLIWSGGTARPFIYFQF